MVTRSTDESVLIGPSPIWKLDARRTTCSIRMTNAGPETKADAMNRGARSAEFQNGLPPSPA